MRGGRSQKKKINVGLLLTAAGMAFNVLALIIGAFMAYAYLNGATTERIKGLEHRIGLLERERPSGGR